MGQKRMLIADADTKAWDEFRQALDDSWVVVGAASGGVAMAEAQKEPFDAVVANYDMPGPGGAELLNQIRMASPRTLRFIAANPAQKEQVMCSVSGCHQFLSVPFDRQTLKGLIERALEIDYGMNDKVRELVSRIRTFPTIPSLYIEVNNALRNPNATTAEVGAIIARDLSMTTKMIQVINSAYFGLPRNITDPTEAVGILGFDTVKSLIMSVKLLSHYEKVKPVYFSIDNIWRHSTNVARTAKVMAMLETEDQECSSVAYTAGLMHDLGKVILAANFDDQYHQAHNSARAEGKPLWDVEKEVFGATHGEIGAYLLSLWGLSSEVVKVAAMHHHPSRSDDRTFSALTAVHVANALEYEAIPDSDSLPVPLIDLEYLQKLEMEDRVEMWRFARRNPDSSKLDHRNRSTSPPPKPALKTVAPPPPPPTPPPLPAAAKASRRKKEAEPIIEALQEIKERGEEQRRRLFTGKLLVNVVGLALVAGLVWVTWMQLKQPARLAQQLTAVRNLINTAILSRKSSPAAPAAAAAPVAAAPTANAETPTASQSSDGSAPAEAPGTPLDRLKLGGIFFSRHPTALVNGQMVSVNEEVSKCRVVEITPSSITLTWENQRKTLTFK